VNRRRRAKLPREPRPARFDARLGDAALNLLLDTHVWVWSQETPERLGRRTSGLLLSGDNINTVCAISTLEMARLVAAGDIELSMPLRDSGRRPSAIDVRRERCLRIHLPRSSSHDGGPRRDDRL
jgi:hypothetical protein